ncbi:MAG: hypothetical protein Q9205_006297 [Flavoplaca limonia]
MADPLSVSASIAGLVTLADLVFRRIFKYVHAVKGASQEISALSSEVGALYGILNNLYLVSCQLEDETLFSNARVNHINSCTQTLEKLRIILDKDSTSSSSMERMESIKRKLHWPFTASQVKTLLAELERHKSTLSLALNADSMLGFVQSLSTQGAIKDSMDEIKLHLKQRHETDIRIALDAKRQKILETFGKLDPKKSQKTASQLRQPGTGLWLMESQEYLQWARTDGSKLWLYGIPGAGKTVLAATLIEEALHTSDRTHFVAFFYCDYNDPATQKPHLILGSLIQQFAKQDERSFEKVQEYCEWRNVECRSDFEYDNQELRNLVIDITSSLEHVIIIVDGLDECGANTLEVTELLASLNLEDGVANLKTLFLSRDELDIREKLGSCTQLAIGARSHDLRLYVGAEIDTRIRKNKLRIKDQSLKEYIMETLVNGAEGMFRWVACQMDHLCELPNDASRRKALSNLPPTLTATYERILRRVNASNRDVQLLVSRALRWVIYGDTSTGHLNTAALCEAVSIDRGDTQRDEDNIVDKTEILRWCSSLIRQAADDDYLELAHFTVKEFLQGIGPERSGEFAIYRMDPDDSEAELAKVCLTYLNFQDFDKDIAANDNSTTRRFKENPLRKYAVGTWDLHAQHRVEPVTYEKAMAGVAEAGALHYASILALPEICTWLIDNGCEVDRSSRYGTPFHCALLGLDALISFDQGMRYSKPVSAYPHAQKITSILMEAGATLHHYKTSKGTYSPLFLSLYHSNEALTISLLKEGATVDDQCLKLLEATLSTPEVQLVGGVIDHITSQNVHEKDMPELLRLQIAAGRNPTSRLMETESGNTDIEPLQSAKYGSALRAAAKYGQIDVLIQVLKRPNINVDDADRDDGTTALHLAAMTDHHDIVKLLQTHGANSKKVDHKGRAAVHHAIRAKGSMCLQYFLDGNADTLSRDKDGYSLWHLAALEDNKESLDYLERYPPLPHLSSMKSTDGWSPLLCAASVGSVACVEWFIRAGCSVTDVGNNGNTALHLAVAAKSGSLEVTRVLIAGACNVNTLGAGGISPLMIAARLGRVEIMDLLMHEKADLSVVDDNGCNVVHHACDGGHLNIVQRLRYTDVDWNVRGIFSSSWSWPWTNVYPLHVAAINPKSDVLEYLLDEGLVSDINARTIITDATRHYSATALETSVVFSCSSNVSTLLSRNADTTIRCYNGELPIHIAARRGNLAVIAAFLEHGYDGEVPNPRGLDCEAIALESGHISAAKMFKDQEVKRGSNTSSISQLNWFQISIHDLIDMPMGEESSWHPWYTNDDIFLPEHLEVATPLHIAASVGDARTVKFLLEKGADIDTTDGELRTPLHLVAATDNSIMTELLLDSKANVHAVDKRLKTPCMVAALSGQLGPLQIMITKGADLRTKDFASLTALHYAADFRHLAVTSFLLTNYDGVAQAYQEPGYYSAASLILSYGTWHELHFLLNFAPDPEVYNDAKANCLTACCQNQHMTKSLLGKFIRRMSQRTAQMLVHQRRSVGGTPLYTACTLVLPHQHVYLIDILLELGADLEQEGGDHGTPLMGACAAGRLTAVKILLAKGAKMVYSNINGTIISALDKAKAQNGFRNELETGSVKGLLSGSSRPEPLDTCNADVGSDDDLLDPAQRPNMWESYKHDPHWSYLSKFKHTKRKTWTESLATTRVGSPESLKPSSEAIPELPRSFQMVIHTAQDMMGVRIAQLDIAADMDVISMPVVESLSLCKERYEGEPIRAGTFDSKPQWQTTFDWHVARFSKTYTSTFVVLEEAHSGDIDILIGRPTIEKISFYKKNAMVW